MNDKKEYYRNYFQTVVKPRLRKRYEKPCTICQKLIHTKGAMLCRSCSSKGRMANWKGGRIMSRGYVYLYMPGHPKVSSRKYVTEHLVVWERSHGKPLPNGWVIHHLNGVKSDNRIGNLLGMPYKRHHAALVQQAMQERIRSLESLINNHLPSPW